MRKWKEILCRWIERGKTPGLDKMNRVDMGVRDMGPDEITGITVELIQREKNPEQKGTAGDRLIFVRRRAFARNE